jgi:hypothetical protein
MDRRELILALVEKDMRGRLRVLGEHPIAWVVTAISADQWDQFYPMLSWADDPDVPVLLFSQWDLKEQPEEGTTRVTRTYDLNCWCVVSPTVNGWVRKTNFCHQPFGVAPTVQEIADDVLLFQASNPLPLEGTELLV